VVTANTGTRSRQEVFDIRGGEFVVRALRYSNPHGFFLPYRYTGILSVPVIGYFLPAESPQDAPPPRNARV